MLGRGSKTTIASDGKRPMTIGKPALFLGQIGIIHLLIVYHALSQDADLTHVKSKSNGKNVVVRDIGKQTQKPKAHITSPQRAALLAFPTGAMPTLDKKPKIYAN